MIKNDNYIEKTQTLFQSCKTRVILEFQVHGYSMSRVDGFYTSIKCDQFPVEIELKGMNRKDYRIKTLDIKRQNIFQFVSLRV